ncbi:phosphate acetyltransferase [Campylobacter sputorum]|uniref:phosphate acetyltransferase n=1 Tax=Campylobacter sputorum TaxID=206 RepID=UPI0027E1B937|nr:phosphate acetyltransferase [Campylobacter sputorum]
MCENSFYLITDNQNDIQNLPTNIECFYPICDKNGAVFSEEKAKELLLNNQKNELLKSIIEEFDKKAQNSALAVVANENFCFLNLEIARNLNLPIINLSKCEFKKTFFKNNAENKGLSVINLADLKELNSKLEECLKTKKNIITPLKFETQLYKMAKNANSTIVLPESDDERILKAACIILKSKAVNLILLGKNDEISANAQRLGLNLKDVKIIDPQNNEYLEEFANTLYELRKAKGMKLEEAQKLVKDRTYFGTMLVYSGYASGMVSGASTTTAETIRPALQTIKMKPGVSTVSGAFLMCLENEVVVFADCAITPNPTEEQLSSIAISSAKTARDFGLDPKIAMLSYSTGESGSGEDVDFIKRATKLAKDSELKDSVDGPLQFDAAFDEIVAKKKMPNSKVAGRANVFVFPNLNCGNICYKAVQRTSGAVAIGPILQGLKKPVNDLSRGCLVEDIVNTILITAIQAKEI